MRVYSLIRCPMFYNFCILTELLLYCWFSNWVPEVLYCPRHLPIDWYCCFKDVVIWDRGSIADFKFYRCDWSWVWGTWFFRTIWGVECVWCCDWWDLLYRLWRHLISQLHLISIAYSLFQNYYHEKSYPFHSSNHYSCFSGKGVTKDVFVWSMEFIIVIIWYKF